MKDRPPRITLLLFVAQVSTITAQAIAYGSSLAADRFEAVTVAVDPDALRRLQEDWVSLGVEVPLVIVESGNQEFLRPAMRYVRSLGPAPDHSIVVLIPELVVNHWYEAVFHNQCGSRLKAALRDIPWVVVVDVPMRYPQTQESE